MFNSTDRTPDYEAAVAALKRLPIKQREQAYGEALADDLRASHARRLGDCRRQPKTWRILVGKRPAELDNRLPGDDHIELWHSDRVLTYVSHPYELDLEKLRAIVVACERYGLEASVHGDSWYYPGRTFRVEYTRA